MYELTSRNYIKSLLIEKLVLSSMGEVCLNCSSDTPFRFSVCIQTYSEEA